MVYFPKYLIIHIVTVNIIEAIIQLAAGRIYFPILAVKSQISGQRARRERNSQGNMV